MRRKLTKHVLGRVAQQIGEYQNMIAETTGIHKKVYGIYFSNEGAKGREPLFDASVNGTKDIFAYWEDEDNGIICISAPDPGYEIRAPKSMDFIFSWYIEGGLKYLDVTHLDVSHTTSFWCCFMDFGSTEDSYIRGLETWNPKNGECFAQMFRRAFYGHKKVELDLSSWHFEKTDISFACTFNEFAPNAKEVYLNLNGWNTENGLYFGGIFDDFAINADNIEILGNATVQRLADAEKLKRGCMKK